MNRTTHHNPRRAPLALISTALIVVSVPVAGVIVIFWREWLAFAEALPWLAYILQFVLFGSVAAMPVVGLVLVCMRYVRPRYIDAHHITRLTLAQRSQGLPAGVQSLSYHDSHKELPAPTPEPAQIAAPAITPPTLLDAITRGWSTPERWIVGVDSAGTPQQIVLKHTGFIAHAGVQGTGKTNAAALQAAQCAAHGGTLFVADPHYGDAESLSTRIQPLSGAVAAFASTPDAINAMIAKVDSIYRHRSANPGIYPALLLIIDEFMDLMIRKELTDESVKALLALSSTGRKKQMFAALIAANWNMRALGGYGVSIRQNVTSALVFNSSIETAELLLPTAYAQQVLLLKPGQTLFFPRGSEPTLTITPEVHAADMALGARAAPPAVAPAQSIAPTVRVPVQAAAPTNQLSSTIPDQILLLLDGAGRFMTASEIAATLRIDLQVIRVVIGDMYKAGQLIRRECQGRTTRERYEYKRSINKHPSGPLVASA